MNQLDAEIDAQVVRISELLAVRRARVVLAPGDVRDNPHSWAEQTPIPVG